jgi:predicted  nucleic acid-binding Zn-ribbon protein
VIEALLDLQDVDGRIMALEKELKDLPVRRAQEVARLNGSIADLKAAKAAQEQITNRINSYDEDAKALQQKIDDLKRAQTTLKTNKEYQQYSIQIDLLEHDKEVTSNSSLAAMDEMGSAAKRVEEAQAKYDAEKSCIDERTGEIDERIALVKQELEEANAERAEKEKAVDDPQFKLYYERLRTKRWPVVVVLTGDGVCDGCHLQQPPSVSQLVDQNAKNADQGARMRIVACNMCGRILYR